MLKARGLGRRASRSSQDQGVPWARHFFLDVQILLPISRFGTIMDRTNAPSMHPVETYYEFVLMDNYPFDLRDYLST